MPIDADVRERLLALYPALADMPVSLLQEGLVGHATALQVSEGEVLFDQGSPCQGFPMLLAGEVRVSKSAPDGRALELYRVQPGELCVASTGCTLGEAALSAQGVATAPTVLLLLAPAGLQLWLAHAPFRRLVFGIFAERMAELMALVEAVAFQRLDVRLAAALLGHGTVVHTTHQALADELGTVREIVSRLLKRFERDGWIAVARERIDIRAPAALRALAAGPPR